MIAPVISSPNNVEAANEEKMAMVNAATTC